MSPNSESLVQAFGPGQTDNEAVTEDGQKMAVVTDDQVERMEALGGD